MIGDSVACATLAGRLAQSRVGVERIVEAVDNASGEV